jgi:hypothetical protein
MKVRALDINEDWTFGKGKSNYFKDIDAIKQNIKTRIKSWKYNCFFAKNDGVDWNNYFNIGTKNQLDLDIKRVILQTNGVLRITEYESTMTERAIGITVTIVTIYGTTSVVY